MNSEYKRVFCLYRVSTLRQVDVNDLPMQKTACRQFCNERGWTIVRELQEFGVSAYKKSTFERKAIREIMQAAKAREFDVLLVYMLDRISRRDSEIPVLFEELTKCQIAVWSVEEGEHRFTNPMDRLFTFINGWKANGESLKISQRIKTKQLQMISQGEYRGGTIPFGYKLVENGKISKQGKPKHNLVVDEIEADIIRMIFDKIANENMSMYQMSMLLNSMKLQCSKNMEWRRSTMHSILHNPIYVGRLKFGKELSLPFQHLQIVDPYVFQKAQDAITRSRKMRDDHPQQEPAPAYHDVIYCSHCGTHLVYNHVFQTNADGSISIRYLYRCYSKERFSKPCDGPATYSARIIDSCIHKHTSEIVQMISVLSDKELVCNAVEISKGDFLEHRDSLQKQKAVLEEKICIVQNGIVEALSQYGVSATTELQILYGDLTEQRNMIQINIDKLKPEAYSNKTLLQQKKKELTMIRALCDLWNQSQDDKKVSVITHFIERVEISRDYQFKYHLTPEIKQFLSD